MATTTFEEQEHRVSELSDDVLIEILSRVNYKSVCRFKCVSRSWLALCSSPELRRRSPQALAGFFCYALCDHQRRLLNVSGKGQPLLDPSFPFLDPYKDIALVESCNGLLLCKCWSYGRRYVVCNPATEKWMVLPRNRHKKGENIRTRIYLGFEPAVSSHFTVFSFSLMLNDQHQLHIQELGIYSSESGEWTYRQSGYDAVRVPNNTNHQAQAVFLNGSLYLIASASSSVLIVSKDGDTWINIPLPSDTEPSDTEEGSTTRKWFTEEKASVCWSLGCAQGRVHALWLRENMRTSQLKVWVLEDCQSSGRWILKHTTSLAQVFRGHKRLHGFLGFCPDWNLIFRREWMGIQANLVSYNMDTGEGHVLCSPEEYYLFRPYTPCFLDWLSDGP